MAKNNKTKESKEVDEVQGETPKTLEELANQMDESPENTNPPLMYKNWIESLPENATFETFESLKAAVLDSEFVPGTEARVMADWLNESFKSEDFPVVWARSEFQSLETVEGDEVVLPIEEYSALLERLEKAEAKVEDLENETASLPLDDPMPAEAAALFIINQLVHDRVFPTSPIGLIRASNGDEFTAQKTDAGLRVVQTVRPARINQAAAELTRTSQEATRLKNEINSFEKINAEYVKALKTHTPTNATTEFLGFWETAVELTEQGNQAAAMEKVAEAMPLLLFVLGDDKKPDPTYKPSEQAKENYTAQAMTYIDLRIHQNKNATQLIDAKLEFQKLNKLRKHWEKIAGTKGRTVFAWSGRIRGVVFG